MTSKDDKNVDRVVRFSARISGVPEAPPVPAAVVPSSSEQNKNSTNVDRVVSFSASIGTGVAGYVTAQVSPQSTLEFLLKDDRNVDRIVRFRARTSIDQIVLPDNQVTQDLIMVPLVFAFPVGAVAKLV